MALPDYAQIEKLGGDIARDVIGAEHVSRVQLKPYLTYDGDPAYAFHVAIDPAPLMERLGHIRLDFLLGMRHALDERGDDHEVFLRLEDGTKLPKGASAA